MVRVEWFEVSDKIVKQFNENVFETGIGPDFYEWLFKETGSNLVHLHNKPYLEFSNEEDLIVYLLRWR